MKLKTTEYAEETSYRTTRHAAEFFLLFHADATLKLTVRGNYFDVADLKQLIKTLKNAKKHLESTQNPNVIED